MSGAVCPKCETRTEVMDAIKDRSRVRFCGWCGKKLGKADQDRPYEETVAYARANGQDDCPWG